MNTPHRVEVIMNLYGYFRNDSRLNTNARMKQEEDQHQQGEDIPNEPKDEADDDLLHRTAQGYETSQYQESDDLNIEEVEDTITDLYTMLRTPLIQSSLRQKVQLPEDVRQRMVWTPDHVEEARRECVYEFIEEVFLPLVESGEFISAIRLTKLAERFKADFEQRHPADRIGNYELLPAVEMDLLKLRMQLETRARVSQEWMKLETIVDNACETMRALLDSDEDLYAV